MKDTQELRKMQIKMRKTELYIKSLDDEQLTYLLEYAVKEADERNYKLGNEK